MNVVGEIGNFIMIYQEPIQGAAIFIFLVIGLVCVYRAVVNGRKKRRLLEQIQESVSEINANVKSLGEQNTKVVYIEGTETPENSVPKPVAGKAEKILPVQKPEEEESFNQEENPSPAEPGIPAVKYFSRDCAVAKDGRQYTFEELNAQIRD